MRPPVVMLAVLAMALCLAGCKQMEKIVRINADGSGTIEETILRNKDMIEWSAKMAEQNAQPPFFDEERCKGAAARMGEGITFVSAKQFKTEKGDGFTVIYAFTDISKVKLDPNPDDLSDTSVGSPPPKPEKLITFRFDKGVPAELHVVMPSADLKPDAAEIDFSKLNGETIQALREGLKDMRSTLAIEVAGTIRETNAEYRQGSRVTLNAMDFGNITADKQKFEALLKAGNVSNRTEKEMLSGIEGVKIEVASDVKIQFQ